MAILAEKAMWGDKIVKLFEQIIPKLGIEIAGVWRPSPRASDLTAELMGIKAANSHIILVLFAGPAGHIFPQQWGELQIPTAVIGSNHAAADDKHWKETGGECEYTSFYTITTHCGEMTPKTVPFRNAYEAKFSERSGQFAGAIYDALYIYKSGIEDAGTLDNDAIVKELENIEYVGTGGITAYYPKDHKWPHDTIFGPGYLTLVGGQWIDGQIKLVWPDGKSGFGEAYGGKKWEGFKYKGTTDYKLPPWMEQYWSAKK